MNEYVILWHDYTGSMAERAAIIEAATADDAITIWRTNAIYGPRQIPAYRVMPVQRFPAALAANGEKSA